MDAAIAIPLAAIILGMFGFGVTFLTFRQSSEVLRRNEAEIARKANIDWVDELQSRINFLTNEKGRLERELGEVRVQLADEKRFRQEEHKKCEEDKEALEKKHQKDKEDLMNNIDFMRRQLNLPPPPKPEKEKP